MELASKKEGEEEKDKRREKGTNRWGDGWTGRGPFNHISHSHEESKEGEVKEEGIGRQEESNGGRSEERKEGKKTGKAGLTHSLERESDCTFS